MGLGSWSAGSRRGWGTGHGRQAALPPAPALFPASHQPVCGGPRGEAGTNGLNGLVVSSPSDPLRVRPSSPRPRGPAVWFLVDLCVSPAQPSGLCLWGAVLLGAGRGGVSPGHLGSRLGGSGVGLVREMRPGASWPETLTPSPSPRSLSCRAGTGPSGRPHCFSCAPRREETGFCGARQTS